MSNYQPEEDVVIYAGGQTRRAGNELDSGKYYCECDPPLRLRLMESKTIPGRKYLRCPKYKKGTWSGGCGTFKWVGVHIEPEIEELVLKLNKEKHEEFSMRCAMNRAWESADERKTELESKVKTYEYAFLAIFAPIVAALITMVLAFFMKSA